MCCAEINRIQFFVLLAEIDHLVHKESKTLAKYAFFIDLTNSPVKFNNLKVEVII